MTDVQALIALLWFFVGFSSVALSIGVIDWIFAYTKANSKE